jgi:hypothetical protein
MAPKPIQAGSRQGAGRSEARAAQIAMLTAALAVAHQVAAKSLREGLFLSTFSLAQLPRIMLGSALLAIPTAFFVARLMMRHGPAHVAPAMFVVSATLSVTEWLLFPSLPRAIAILVYLHVSVGGALLASAFWSVVNERFDPHTLRHLVGRIGASATLGGLVGGAAMERVAYWVDARSALLLVSGLCLAAAAGSQRLGAALRVPSVATSEPPAKARFTRYLWTLALLVACSAASSTFSDFALKQAAYARFGSAVSLVRFFAVFYTGASLVSFLLQVLVSRSLLATIGIGGTLAVPPLAGVALGLVSLLSPSFMTIGALRGSDLAFGPSLFRSAFEPLFAPLPAATKRGTKALVDVLFDKAGDAAASLLILGIALGGPLVVLRAPLLLATLAFAVTLFLSFRARRGYVAELESSLRAGTLQLEGIEVLDATTRLTLSVTAFGFDRAKLLEQIALAREANPAAAAGARRGAPAELAEDPLVAEVRVLLGSDSSAIRALLGRPALDVRLAAFVAPHLGVDALAKSAVFALRSMGPTIAGLLADVMLSSSAPLALRRRIPHVLRTERGEAVAQALLRALSADALEVRYRAALALLEVVRDEPALRPEAKQVHALVLSEVGKGALSAAAFDHVFALLALSTRGTLELARQGLLCEDRKLRGTALEYLESLLHESVRSAVVAALAARPEPRTDVPRSETQLLDELKRSFRPDISAPTLALEPD